MSPDVINGLFEAGGSVAVGLSVKALLRSKRWAGLSPWQLLFFQSWGLWNLFYYPSLHQLFSFVGGACLALANTIYLILIWRYRDAR